MWHDGEFPISDERANDTKEVVPPRPFVVHCCDAAQFIDFGLTILEAQVAHQKSLTGEPVSIADETIDEATRRLTALRSKR